MRLLLVLLWSSFSMYAMDDKLLALLNNASLEEAAQILLETKTPAGSDEENERSPLENFHDLFLFFSCKAMQEEVGNAGDESAENI